MIYEWEKSTRFIVKTELNRLQKKKKNHYESVFIQLNFDRLKCH